MTNPGTGPEYECEVKPPRENYTVREALSDGIVTTHNGMWEVNKGDMLVYLNGQWWQVMTPAVFAERFTRTRRIRK